MSENDDSQELYGAIKSTAGDLDLSAPVRCRKKNDDARSWRDILDKIDHD